MDLSSLKLQIPMPNSQANLNPQIPKTSEPRISRITRIWKNCIPNISAIRVIRGPRQISIGKFQKSKSGARTRAQSQSYRERRRCPRNTPEQLNKTVAFVATALRAVLLGVKSSAAANRPQVRTPDGFVLRRTSGYSIFEIALMTRSE